MLIQTLVILLTIEIRLTEESVPLVKGVTQVHWTGGIHYVTLYNQHF
jgi:hypothetical protein